MEYQTFEQLVLKMKGGFFAGTKRDTVNKSLGSFTAQQIYRLQGQFTGGNDRVHMVSDLKTSKRILPMTAKDAEPIIKMGIYVGQRKTLLQLLAEHIADRQQSTARQLLGRNFIGADNSWMNRVLDQAGPYEGPPPVATVTGPGPTIITSNVILANPVGTHYQQDPISYVAQNAGSALFGGIMTANIPAPQTGVTTTVVYPGTVPTSQYPMTSQPSTALPTTEQTGAAPAQPNLYPSLSAYGAAPPAYTPVDVNTYSQVTQYAAAPPYPPQGNITYPPSEASTYQGNQLPAKTPVP